MNIKDVLGIGKVLPIDKLIDLVAKATGALTKSYFDKKDVNTKAYEIRELAKAKADAMKTMSAAISENATSLSGINYSDAGLTIDSFKQTRKQYISSLPSLNLAERSENRLKYQEARKQINIESVTAAAAEELKNEPPILDSTVDEGWSTRFFKYVEDVSDEEMQSIWGKILAGEIKQPNTFSLRTLELLRNISKQEAEIFSVTANYSINTGDDAFLYKENLEQYGLSFSKLAVLRELGIIYESDITHYSISTKNNDASFAITSGNILIITKLKADAPEKSIPVHVFTTVGKQLLKLIKVAPDINYLNSFANFMKVGDTEVGYTFGFDKLDDGYNYIPPLLEFPIS